MWKAFFSLPLDDAKNSHCKPFNYVELTDIDGEYIGLFRIIPAKTRKLATINEVQYECEHVLSTLLNDVLFRYHQRTNFTTRQNIEYVLARQTTKHWRLGSCELTRYFHYKWENENGLLGALFSISEPIDEPYVWTWDTQTYPWTINLVKPTLATSAEVRFGKNLAQIEREVDPANIVNRLYPLGYGEGVNQLDIKRANNGREYIENSASIAEYGLQSYVWVDRRFEDVESLYASAQKFLSEWSVPKVTYRVTAVDLSSITGLSIDKFTVGKVLRVVDPEIGTFDARIVNERKADIIGAPYAVEFELSNKADGVGSTLADIERRQEINEVYAQGATNILSFNYQDNCDANIPALIPFYIDDDVVNVNRIELTFRTKRFRAYSRATEGGGAIIDSTKGGGGTTRSTTAGGGTTRSTTSGGGTTQSTTAGGGTTSTSSSGGGTSTSTQSGGGTSQTSSAGGDHRHVVFNNADDFQGPILMRTFRDASGGLARFESDRTSLTTAGSSGNHSHSVSVPSHTHNFSTPNHTHTITLNDHSHSVTIPSHSHDVTIPAHSHEVTIPDHTHEIELPNHTHEVKHEIVELSNTPSRVTIRVDGNVVPHTSTSGDRINLAYYLSKDVNGRITRGRHEVSITPNGLARIEADLILRVFIQSQLGEVL